MKRRLLKKVVKKMRADSPARFRANGQVKREWVRRFEEAIPEELRTFGTIHYDYDRAGLPEKCSFGQWVFVFEFQLWRRIIARTEGAGFRVSTVFLGLDHGWMHDSARPIVFESMIFGGPLDQVQERYSTRGEALAGHAVLVDRCRAALLAPPFDGILVHEGNRPDDSAGVIQ